MSPIRAVVDREALRANLRRVRAASPGAAVMAVIKANAYGHGLLRVAAAFESMPLAPPDAYAVARLDEALQLRAAGIRRPILLLEGVVSAVDLARAAEHELQIVLHDPAQLAWLAAYRGSHRFTAWLKVDTGMNRLGFRPEEVAAVRTRLADLPVPLADCRLMTHLARADEPDCDMTSQQLAKFDAVLGEWGTAAPVCSIANSAGAFLWPAARRGWLRPGISLYGASPSPSRAATDFGLAPVMSLESEVIALRAVPRGETVGYGGSWRAERASRIAIVAGGYGDGVPRHLPSGAPVSVAGRRAPLAGRVSMDMVAVDVTGRDDVHVGTPVQFWGDALPVDEIAAAAGTIAYEVLCGLAPRVPVVDR